MDNPYANLPVFPPPPEPSLIDLIKELMKELIATLRSLRKDPYPVGSLYWTTKTDNPTIHFGGKWVCIQSFMSKSGQTFEYTYQRIE